MAHTPDPARFCVTCGQPVDGVGEMLAALKGLVAEIENTGLILTDDQSEAVFIRARAVIAKAEGG